MTENSIDEIMQWYDRLIEIVTQVSMDAPEQEKKLYGTVVTDEIASDFCEIGMVYAKKLFDCAWITQEQLMLAKNIYIKFNEMSEKKELWMNEALYASDEWEVCRRMGKKLLKTLKL